METLQEVLAENSGNANAYFELGIVYKAGGLATRAKAMFQKALDANPRHKQALAELATKGKSRPPGAFCAGYSGGRPERLLQMKRCSSSSPVRPFEGAGGGLSRLSR